MSAGPPRIADRGGSPTELPLRIVEMWIVDRAVAR